LEEYSDMKVSPDSRFPDFRSGDTLRVYVRVVEGESERTQMFEGTVIRRRGSGISQTFTLRKNSFGVGVERTFPLHSPLLEKIQVVKRGKVRRGKLYYMRELSGKAARLEEIVEKTVSAPEAAASATQSEGGPKKEAAAPTPAPTPAS